MNSAVVMFTVRQEKSTFLVMEIYNGFVYMYVVLNYLSMYPFHETLYAVMRIRRDESLTIQCFSYTFLSVDIPP